MAASSSSTLLGRRGSCAGTGGADSTHVPRGIAVRILACEAIETFFCFHGIAEFLIRDTESKEGIRSLGARRVAREHALELLGCVRIVCACEVAFAAPIHRGARI